MRKLSQINEGLWSKTFDRARTGEERIEDKITSNIEDLKEVDLGIAIFADDDIVIEGKDMFTYEELLKYKPYVEKNGWKILDIDTVGELMNNKDICVDADFEGVIIYNRQIKQEVKFVIDCFDDDCGDMEWWVYDIELDEKSTDGETFNLIKDGDNAEIHMGHRRLINKFPIRLIKFKN